MERKVYDLTLTHGLVQTAGCAWSKGKGPASRAVGGGCSGEVDLGLHTSPFSAFLL